MKISRRLALLLVFALPSLPARAEDQTIRFGTEGAFPPFNFVSSSGEIGGFEIDLAKAMCETLAAKCTFTTQDFDGLIPALNASKFDVIIASMSATAARAEKVSFTTSYYKDPGRFVVKKGSSLDLTEASLKGKTIGVASGTTHENYLNGEWSNAVKVQAYPKLDDALLDLQSGRIDAVMDNGIALSQSFFKRPESADFEMAKPVIDDTKYYGNGVAMAVRKDDNKLLGTLNDALAGVIAKGDYKNLSEKYFGFDLSNPQ